MDRCKKCGVMVFISFILLWGTVTPLFSQIKIFLHPQVEVGDTDLSLADIASISGSFADLQDVKDTHVRITFLKDGYVDKEEVKNLLLPFQDDVRIYGNSVRILPKEKKKKNKNIDDDFAVQKGQSVEIVIVRNSITVELYGKALVSGDTGDNVTVRLGNNRTFQGVVKEKGVVEVGK